MRILVVDDHPMMADALRLALLSLDRAAEVVCAGDLAGALAATAAEQEFDLALLDLGLPDCAGAEGLERLRRERPQLPVVVVSGASDPDTIVQALDLGAMGFIPKTSPRDVLLNAVRLVASGGVYVPVEALKMRAPRDAPDGLMTALPKSAGAAAPGAAGITPADLGLTPRQADVLSLVLKGLPNKLIARRLDIAENTVKVHVSAVLQALNVHTRTQALIASTRLGLRLDS